MKPSEEYILNQSEPYRSILMHVQSVIEMTISEVDLKYKYRVPFYYVEEKPFCYLNQSKDYVDIGFWHGAHLTNNVEYMTTAGRRMIKSLRYTSLEEINDAVLIAVLQEAYAVRKKRLKDRK